MPTKAWIEVPIDQEIESVPPIGEYAPIFFPPEGGYVVMQFTDTSFLQVLSALINGAMLTYPNEWLQVVWYFLQNVEYPVPICQLLIDCIENDEDVQAVLRAFMTNDETVRDFVEDVVQEGIPIGITEGNETIVQSDDLAALAGAITFLVDTIHGANLDLYEAVESSENKRELGEILFEAMPVVETLPFDEVSEYFDELKAAVAEGYAAQWTTTPITGKRDRVRCALFCMAKENGNSLSWSMIADYFWNEVGFTPADIADMMIDFINFFLSGSWVGEEIVDISFANVATALAVSQQFGGMTFPGLTTLMKLGLNDPDPDYETWCEDCPEPPTERTPVVSSQWDPSNAAGIITGPDEDGFYLVTSELRATDYGFVIADIEDRTFVLTDISYDAPPACQVFYNHPTLNYLACPGINVYTSEVLTEFWSTWPTAAGPLQMQFKMIPA